jgi:predicted enzyme related to lactoylglutathione lyase
MGVAGMMELPPEMRAGGARTAWNGYIHVEDVDAHAARVERMGGRICMPPADIPNVGRFAFVADPQGAEFYLFKPNGTAQSFPPDTTPGYIGWRELITRDAKAAFAFYSELFGWQKTEAMDMGPMGVYQIFSTGEGQRAAMMNGEAGRTPAWRYYFSVADLDQSVARVKELGGACPQGIMPVPENQRVAVCRDSQDVELALVGR